VTKHYKKIIVIWIVALLLAVPLMLQVGNVTDYQQDLGSGDDQESVLAQRIIDTNFQQSVANGTIMVLLQADDVTGPEVRSYVLELQRRILDDPDITHLEGVSSVYTYSEDILSLVISEIGPVLHQTEDQINASAFMLWGVPALHVDSWVNSGFDDAAAYANTSMVLSQYLQNEPLERQGLVMGYFNAFTDEWNATPVADPAARAEAAVNAAAPPFLSSLPLPDEQTQVMQAVLGRLQPDHIQQ